MGGCKLDLYRGEAGRRRSEIRRYHTFSAKTFSPGPILLDADANNRAASCVLWIRPMLGLHLYVRVSSEIASQVCVSGARIVSLPDDNVGSASNFVQTPRLAPSLRPEFACMPSHLAFAGQASGPALVGPIALVILHVHQTTFATCSVRTDKEKKRARVRASKVRLNIAEGRGAHVVDE